MRHSIEKIEKMKKFREQRIYFAHPPEGFYDIGNDVSYIMKKGLEVGELPALSK